MIAMGLFNLHLASSKLIFPEDKNNCCTYPAVPLFYQGWPKYQWGQQHDFLLNTCVPSHFCPIEMIFLGPMTGFEAPCDSGEEKTKS